MDPSRFFIGPIDFLIRQLIFLASLASSFCLIAPTRFPPSTPETRVVKIGLRDYIFATFGMGLVCTGTDGLILSPLRRNVDVAPRISVVFL